MTPVVYLQAPEGAPAGAMYFKCVRLTAELSTTSCAAQWKAASTKIESACHSCLIGQAHAQSAGGHASIDPRQGKPRICLRCGRNDLRVVQERGICLSCYNRELEWRKGCDAKGKPPVNFPPLSTFTTASEAADGSITHHSIEAQHAAEAVGVLVHTHPQRLPENAVLSEKRLGQSAWDEAKGRFVVKCPKCGHDGLLERKKGSTLRHHCPGCEGAPSGPGWKLAKAGMWAMLIDVGGLKAWLDASKEEFPHDRWSFTGFGCRHCKSAVLQARGTEKAGTLIRCPACGETSE